MFLGEVPAADDGLPSSASAKAEGLAVTAETTDYWDVIVVYDGLKNGHGVRLRVEKP
jgi:hypothetical protein